MSQSVWDVIEALAALLSKLIAQSLRVQTICTKRNISILKTSPFSTYIIHRMILFGQKNPYVTIKRNVKTKQFQLMRSSVDHEVRVFSQRHSTYILLYDHCSILLQHHHVAMADAAAFEDADEPQECAPSVISFSSALPQRRLVSSRPAVSEKVPAGDPNKTVAADEQQQDGDLEAHDLEFSSDEDYDESLYDLEDQGARAGSKYAHLPRHDRRDGLI